MNDPDADLDSRFRRVTAASFAHRLERSVRLWWWDFARCTSGLTVAGWAETRGRSCVEPVMFAQNYFRFCFSPG